VEYIKIKGRTTVNPRKTSFASTCKNAFVLSIEFLLAGHLDFIWMSWWCLLWKRNIYSVRS